MIDRSVLNILESAKAYAALIGSLLLLVLSSGVIVDVPVWAEAVAALLVAFSVWKIPNAAPSEPVASRVEPVIEAP
jgi:hypothetical protein